MSEPHQKKRRLGQNGEGSKAGEQSFAAILKQLEAEEDSNEGKYDDYSQLVHTAGSIETSAAWPRPQLPHLNPSTDTISEIAHSVPRKLMCSISANGSGRGDAS